MRIIPIHYAASAHVDRWSDIKDEVAALKEFIPTMVDGRKAVALHHSQVSDMPYNFFVLHPEVVGAGVFDHQVVVNPELAKNETNIEFDRKQVLEGCMSFTLRPYIKVHRYTAIAVRYQTPSFFGLKDHTEVVYGLMAQVFQHEIQHSKGQNIYQK